MVLKIHLSNGLNRYKCTTDAATSLHKYETIEKYEFDFKKIKY